MVSSAGEAARRIADAFEAAGIEYAIGGALRAAARWDEIVRSFGPTAG